MTLICATVAIVQSAPGEVQLQVVNRGITIDPPHLLRLFDRFYRGDASRNHSDQNHGLGLAIVAAIARMHGGRPLASSSEGNSSIGMTLQDWAADATTPGAGSSTAAHRPS